jgi:hypothetical protein
VACDPRCWSGFRPSMLPRWALFFVLLLGPRRLPESRAKAKASLTSIRNKSKPAWLIGFRRSATVGRRVEGRAAGAFGACGCAAVLACVSLALTLGAVAGSATSPARAPSFAGPRSYATGGNPDSVTIGDLNGDGKPDLTTTSFGGNSVSVLINRGDGSFAAKVDYATGSGPLSVAIGDLNGDGKPDLATANEEGTTNEEGSVSVLLNRGDGSFHAKRDYVTGFDAQSVAIGDLSGDGSPDLATANYITHTVSVLLNRGNGSFRPRRDYQTGDTPDSVAIGDLNGDGKPDLAATKGTNAVSVLLNGGGGNFQPKLDYRAGAGPVAMGDLNGDGKPDLVTLSDSDNVSVLINTPGLCTVQNVVRQALASALRTIARANCRVGTIRRAYSKIVKRARGISQKPRPLTVLPRGGKVNLVVSRRA